MMGNLKVINEVNVYKVDGSKVEGLDGVKLLVKSGFLSREIVLDFEGKEYTVMGHDLQAAITNALNTSH